MEKNIGETAPEIPKKKFRVGVEMEVGGKDGQEITDSDLWETVEVEAANEDEARDIVFNKMDFGNRRPTGYSEVSEIVKLKGGEAISKPHLSGTPKHRDNAGTQNFEQISKGPKLIQDEDLQYIIPLLRDHYQIETPTEKNVTPEIVQHVWDKLALHADDGNDEGVKRQLAKEILELNYSESKSTPEELKKEALYELGRAAHERHFRLDRYPVDKIIAGWDFLDEEVRKLALSSFPDVAIALLDKKINKK